MIKKNMINIRNNNALVQEESLDDFCGSSSDNRFTMIMPNKPNPANAQLQCNILNAELYIQRTEVEYRQMLKDTNPSLIKKCPLLILPYFLNNNGKWLDQDGNSIPNDMRWGSSEPNGGGLQKCSVTKTSTYELHDIFCDLSGTGCFVCMWTQKPVLLLKGMCLDAKIEYRFILEIGETYNDNLVFKGFNSLFMIYYKDLDTWTLSKSMKSNGNEIIASQVSKQPTPLGLHEWNFQHDGCKGIRWLKMSSVSP